ncbi:hypothetical protein OOT00_10960 [Desulfobotulus sp. H1]|uniref:Transporter n=1 Tax=Desulfobotulus pelophilus TaxID=2823377 RepID=A0ABT3NAN2_9BACT|nr:hypothetical protein [Desulfobotulus pelophilus]MCW7754504.1 hypothetical protein [Desulfobotulus pelophilus]
MTKKSGWVIMLFASLVLGSATGAWAGSREASFALFKRSISPVYHWGQNGLITVPKAVTLGKGNFYLAGSAQDAGKIEGDRLFLTAATIMAGTSEDVELGYTRRQFIWDNLDKTDLEMDTFHFKARIFHMTDTFIPQLALGIHAVSLSDNEFNSYDEILFNPYLAATVQIPLGTEKAMLSLTGVAEVLYNEGETGQAFFSAGADLGFWETLYLVAEIQGINLDDGDPIVNIGARVKAGWFSLGVSLFNALEDKSGELGQEKEDSRYWMGYAAVEIPLGTMLRGKQDR